MPRIFWKYPNKMVACPLRNDLVPLERCQECKYFMYRDLFHVFCEYELDQKFGSGWKLISKNPPRIRTRDGRVFQYYQNGSKYNYTGEWREVK